MVGVKYIAPVFDFSGYGAAARSYIFALHAAGISITVEPRCFDNNPPGLDNPEEEKLLKSLIGKKIDYDVVIVHLTPDLLPFYVDREPDKYFISMTVWETSQLHPLWVEGLNKVNEVWVPCEWNVEAFKASGVKPPVHKIPHGISPETFDGLSDKSFFIKGVDKDNTFVFYSIFQWNHRKNPVGLIRSYYNAFGPDDKVALVVKSYVGGGVSSGDEIQFIRDQVYKIKLDMNLSYYPKLYLVSDKLTTKQVNELHLYGDCYISLHHGEGFCLPALEAGLAGNPVIATGATGNMEFMTSENSYPVDYRWGYVQLMSTFNKWYLGDQQWAEPDLVHASKLMREVYDNQAAAKQKGVLLSNQIKENLNWKKIAQPMVKRLKEL